MKRIFASLLILAVMFLSVPSHADTLTKFNSGVKTVILSPLEVSDNIKAETKDAKFLPFALVGGFLKGGFYMAKKIVTGTRDIVMSPMEMYHK